MEIKRQFYPIQFLKADIHQAMGNGKLIDQFKIMRQHTHRRELTPLMIPSKQILFPLR